MSGGGNNAAAPSAFYELMKTTITLSSNLNCSPFDIFDQETDEVIMLINFYIEMGEKNENNNPVNATPKAEQRIRVNDKTASGGWF